MAEGDELLRLLFICSRNKLRSPTAEAVFAEYDGVEAASAGLNKDSENPVTPELIEWADMIFVMENAHRKRLAANFGKHLGERRVVCLNIPDRFKFMDAELVQILESRVAKFLPRSE